jgi:hypothetical protein
MFGHGRGIPKVPIPQDIQDLLYDLKYMHRRESNRGFLGSFALRTSNLANSTCDGLDSRSPSETKTATQQCMCVQHSFVGCDVTSVIWSSVHGRHGGTQNIIVDTLWSSR